MAEVHRLKGEPDKAAPLDAEADALAPPACPRRARRACRARPAPRPRPRRRPPCPARARRAHRTWASRSRRGARPRAGGDARVRGHGAGRSRARARARLRGRRARAGGRHRRPVHRRGGARGRRPGLRPRGGSGRGGAHRDHRPRGPGRAGRGAGGRRPPGPAARARRDRVVRVHGLRRGRQGRPRRGGRPLRRAPGARAAARRARARGPSAAPPRRRRVRSRGASRAGHAAARRRGASPAGLRLPRVHADDVVGAVEIPAVEAPLAAAPAGAELAGGDGFDLASELGDLFGAQPAVAAQAAAAPGTDLGDASLADIFREFQKGVDKQLGKEDYETRYNLGIAYKEMGLVDEAIAEFQLAAKDEARLLECASMLGICFLEKGMPKLAVKWFEKGLAAPGRTDEEYQGLRYDLAERARAGGRDRRAPSRSSPSSTARTPPSATSPTRCASSARRSGSRDARPCPAISASAWPPCSRS